MGYLPGPLAKLWSHIQSRPQWPGHAAFALTGVSFLVADVLLLRVFAVTSSCLAILFNTWHPVGKTLWLPIRWSVFYACVNIGYIVKLVSERFVWLGERESTTYHSFFSDTMDVKDFAKLIRAGEFRCASTRDEVMTRGEPTTQLLLVTDGAGAEIDVGAGVTIVRERGLLGEISFLHGGSAGATAYVLPGCSFVAWERDVLEELLSREPAVRRALELTIGRELSRKLAANNEDLVAARGRGAERGMQQRRASEAEEILEHASGAEQAGGGGGGGGAAVPAAASPPQAAAAATGRGDDADDANDASLREVEFMQLALLAALRLQVEAGAAERPCGVLFDELHALRRRAGVGDAEYSTALRRLGLQQEHSLRRSGATLGEACASMAAVGVASMAAERMRRRPTSEAHRPRTQEPRKLTDRSGRAAAYLTPKLPPGLGPTEAVAPSSVTSAPPATAQGDSAAVGESSSSARGVVK